MAKSLASRVLIFVRRSGTVTTKQVRDEFGIEQKTASACLCDLRIRKHIKIMGTSQPNATGRPVNLWSAA